MSDKMEQVVEVAKAVTSATTAGLPPGALEAALRILKLAIGIVLLGGGAAFGTAKFMVENHDHPDLHEEVHLAHRQAMEANVNVKVLMSTMGVTPVELPVDAGH